LSHPTIAAVLFMEGDPEMVEEQCCMEIFALFTGLLGLCTLLKEDQGRNREESFDSFDSGSQLLGEPDKIVPAALEAVLPFEKLISLMREHAGSIPTPYNEFYLTLFEAYSEQESLSVQKSSGDGEVLPVVSDGGIQAKTQGDKELEDSNTALLREEKQENEAGGEKRDLPQDDVRKTAAGRKGTKGPDGYVELQLSKSVEEALPAVARVAMASMDKLKANLQNTGGLMKLEGAWVLISQNLAPLLWQLSGHLHNNTWRMNYLKDPDACRTPIPQHLLPFSMTDFLLPQTTPFNKSRRGARSKCCAPIRNCGSSCLCTPLKQCASCFQRAYKAVKDSVVRSESSWALTTKVAADASVIELYTSTITIFAQLLVWDDQFRAAILNNLEGDIAHNHLYAVVMETLEESLKILSTPGAGSVLNGEVMKSWVIRAKELLVDEAGALQEETSDVASLGTFKDSAAVDGFQKAFRKLFQAIEIGLHSISSGIKLDKEKVSAFLNRDDDEDQHFRENFGRNSILHSFAKRASTVIYPQHTARDTINENIYLWMEKILAGNRANLQKEFEIFLSSYQKMMDHPNHMMVAKRSDFEVFVEGGGLMIRSMLKNLPAYCQINFTSALFYISLLSGCLKTKMELAQKKRKASASEKLKGFQVALNSLGSIGMVMQILKVACKFLYDPHAALKIVPNLLEFGSALVNRNLKVQNTVVTGLVREGNQSIQVVPDNDRTEFLLGLQGVFRYLRQRIETATTQEGTSLRPEEEKLFRACYSFLNSLASGNNKLSKSFLREQPRMTESVNLVVEAAVGVQCLGVLASSKMKYIEEPEFFRAVSIAVPGSNGLHRRFIEWQDRGQELQQLETLFSVLSCGLSTLTELIQGPIFENQLIVRRALSNCDELLEFSGTLSLTITKKSALQKKVWMGGDPQKFYLLLLSHILPKKELVNTPFHMKIEKACEDWGVDSKQINKLKKRAHIDCCRKMSNFLWHQTFGRCNGMVSHACSYLKCCKGPSSERISHYKGFDLVKLKKESAAMELQLLMLLSAMLEGQNHLLVEHVKDNINWPIMMQNMGSSFVLSKHNETIREIAVLYLTVLSSLSTASLDESSMMIAKYLDEADREMAAEGIQKEDVISSVEVVGSDGQMQQVFFPVPDLVKKFWDFPKVRRLKEKVKFSVNRESPEEKILDFYKKMDTLYHLLKMQRRLRNTFMWFHIFFGGKTYIPILGDQRKMILAITLLLNFTTIYETYFDDLTYLSDQVYGLDQYEEWKHHKTFNLVAQYLHVVFCCSLCLAELLNSVAAFDVLQKARENSWLDKLKRNSVMLRPLKMMIVLRDKLWFIALLTLSLLGFFSHRLWYAACVIDIIPQIRMMEFLLESISRNISKLFLTVLLGVIMLYIFSTVTYLLYADEYDLDGHMDCQTLLNCFKLHIDYGLLNPPSWEDDGAISTFTEPGLDYKYTTLYHVLYETLSSTYNLIYIILINLVLSAIISGLIIDTFSEMRDENEATQQDILDKCFICSIDRDDFDQLGVSFNKHVQQEHNMWKYLQLKIYLDRKDEFSYTGTEHFLYHGFQKAETFVRLIPIKKALAFERAKGGIKEKNDIATLSLKLRTIEAKQESSSKTLQLCMDKVLSLVDANRDLLDLVKAEKNDIQGLTLKQTELAANLEKMNETLKAVVPAAIKNKK